MNEEQLKEMFMKMNIRKERKLPNFSKLLMSVITGLYVITFITSLILFVCGVPYPIALLETIENIFKIGFVGYCGKSGLENVIKIRKNPQPEENTFQEG